MDDRSSSDSDSSRNSPGIDLNEASAMKQEFNPDSSKNNSFAGGDSQNNNGMRPNPITYATDKQRIYPVSGGMTPHQQQMTRLRDNYHGGKPIYDKNSQPGNRLPGNYQGNNYN